MPLEYVYWQRSNGHPRRNRIRYDDIRREMEIRRTIFGDIETQQLDVKRIGEQTYQKEYWNGHHQRNKCERGHDQDRQKD